MSLYHKIKNVIQDLEFVVRENTTLALKTKSKLKKDLFSDPEVKFFENVSSEMTEITNKTIREINVLEEILNDIKALSRIINVSGSLRMLTQRHIKLVILFVTTGKKEYEQDFVETGILFLNRIDELMYTQFNDSTIDGLVISIKGDWQEYTKALQKDKIELEELVNTNDLILNKVQYLVSRYQNIAG